VIFRLKVEKLIGCGWREDVEASETVVIGPLLLFPKWTVRSL